MLATVRDQPTQLFPIDNPFHCANSDMELCTASGLKNGPEPAPVCACRSTTVNSSGKRTPATDTLWRRCRRFATQPFNYRSHPGSI